MGRMSGRMSRASRGVALSLAIALVGGTTAACTSPAPAGNSTQQFCDFWRKVDAAPPAPDNAVLVKDDVVALANNTTVTGKSCTDPAAKVALDGATIAEGQEVLSEQNSSSATLVAAVTGDVKAWAASFSAMANLSSFVARARRGA